jgi:predicted RNase H-like nuclease
MRFRGSLENTSKAYVLINWCMYLEDMDKFIDAYDLRKLNQEYISHLNRSLTSNGIETVLVFQERKDQMDSLLNSTRP